MELEEATIYLKKITREYETYGDLDNPEFEDTKKIAKSIETVLQELENSISKKKIEDKITYWNKRLDKDERLDWIIKDKCIINVLQELLEDK